MNFNSCRLDKDAVVPRLQWVVLSVGLAVTFVLAFNLRLPDLDWQIALNGWSAIDWVAHLNSPERYVLDFSNGMGLYDKSSSMHVYPLANRWFGVRVEQVIPVVIFLEMAFLAGACIFFARTLSTIASPVGGFLFALLVVLSPARNLDLSHFGAPFFWGLFYNFADGFRLLGLAFFLRRKPVLGSLLLGMGFSIHPIITFYGCAFLVGFVAVERKWVQYKSLTAGILVFLVLSGGWLLYSYDFSSVVSTQVDPQVWIRMARAFSYHFFPIDYGLLTLDFHTRLLPLLVLCLLALHYLPVVCTDPSLRRGLIGGCIVLIALIAAGLVISLYIPIPLLIKLALPRASAMLILVAMAIACIGLAKDMEIGSVFQRFLGLLIVVSPFVYPPGFPLIPVALLILVNRIDRRSGCDLTFRSAEQAGLVFVLIVIFAFWWAGYVQAHNFSAYMGYLAKPDHWQFVVFAGLLLSFLAFITRQHKGLEGANERWKLFAPGFGPVVVLLVVCYLGVSWQRTLVPDSSYRAFGASYLDAQRWARSNTSEQSLFMVDPTISYGWRDFSERSSFGNLREWIHTSWLYDSRADRYHAGMQRFGEFGIPLEPYLDQSVAHLLGHQKLTADIQKRFYELDEKWFVSIRQRYSVSFVVMRKDRLLRNYPFEKAFENEHFVIFDLSRAA